MRTCFKCGGEIPGDRRVLREEECPRCSQDLHCCRQCRFYDTGVSKQCSEPQVEPVLDKERANFCDFYSFAEGRGTGPAGSAEAESAREKWRHLFEDP
jgi:hypothetical protein